MKLINISHNPITPTQIIVIRPVVRRVARLVTPLATIRVAGRHLDRVVNPRLVLARRERAAVGSLGTTVEDAVVVQSDGPVAVEERLVIAGIAEGDLAAGGLEGFYDGTLDF